jgi:hypothetical protein
VRHDAHRADQPERLRLVVELAEEGAAVHLRAAAPGVDTHAAHPREVDHDPVVAGGEPRDAVAAAPDRDLELLLAREPNGREHVG